MDTRTSPFRLRIEKVRDALRAHGLAAVLVPTSDPHLSEYLPERWQGRQWLSGFTGSMGTLVVTLLTGAAADVTGLLLATALAVSGFYVIPRRRRQAQREFAGRIEELRHRLHEGLTRQVHLEISQSGDRINEAIAPYRRFVQSTQQELTDARGELVATEDSLLRLRTEIEQS